MELLVSVCCITYNQENYIRQCLDGFIMQKTNFLFEVLIHDDASTDKTQEIIREYEIKYPDIIKPIYQKENQHSQGKRISSVYNFPRAKGKYIAMCEGDDYWIDPLKLQKQVDFLEKNPEYGLVYTSAKVFDQKKARFLNKKIGFSQSCFEDLLKHNGIPTLTTLYRKEYLDLYLAEGLPKKEWLMGDYPIWLYITSKSRVKFIDEITSVYRLLSSSASHFKTFEGQKNFLDVEYDVKKYFVNRTGKSIDGGLLKSNYYTDLLKIYLNYNHPVEIYREEISLVKSDLMRIKMLKICSQNDLIFKLLVLLKRFHSACLK